MTPTTIVFYPYAGSDQLTHLKLDVETLQELQDLFDKTLDPVTGRQIKILTAIVRRRVEFIAEERKETPEERQAAVAKRSEEIRAMLKPRKAVRK
jgi:hypothetical protein